MRARIVALLILCIPVAAACASAKDQDSRAQGRYSPSPYTYSPPPYIEPTSSPISIPDVVGDKLEAAKAELRSLGLKVRVKYKTSNKKAGTVLTQNPESFAEAEEGDTVTLTVAKQKPAPSDESGGSTSATNCTPGYDPCLPPASDYDCAGGSGDGPEYVSGPVYVDHSYGDPYGLDADGDGVGCES